MWKDWLFVAITIASVVGIYLFPAPLAVQITMVAVLAEMLGTGYVHLLLRTGNKDGFVDEMLKELGGENGKPSREERGGLLAARLELFIYATLWTLVFGTVLLSCSLTFLVMPLTSNQHWVVVAGLLVCVGTAISLTTDGCRQWFFQIRPFVEQHSSRWRSPQLHFGAVYKSPIWWGRSLLSLLAVTLAYVLS